MHSKTR